MIDHRAVRAVLAAGAALVAIVVATSRALLGVHWVSDVVAGLALGWGWFLLVAVAFGGRNAASRRSGESTPPSSHQVDRARTAPVRERIDA